MDFYKRKKKFETFLQLELAYENLQNKWFRNSLLVGDKKGHHVCILYSYVEIYKIFYRNILK